MSQASQSATGRAKKSNSLETHAGGAVYVLSIAGVLTTAIVFNQFVLRFLFGTDLVGMVRPEAQALLEAQVFAAWWPVFVAFAAASAAAALAAPGAVAALAGQPSRLEKTPRSLDVVIWAGAAAAILGYVVSLLLGAEALGGTDRHFYYGGMAVVWLVLVGMLVLAVRYRHREQAFDWLLHNAAVANVQPLIIPQIVFWPLFGLNPQEAYSTAVTLAPVGALFASFFFALYTRNQH